MELPAMASSLKFAGTTAMLHRVYTFSRTPSGQEQVENLPAHHKFMNSVTTVRQYINFSLIEIQNLFFPKPSLTTSIPPLTVCNNHKPCANTDSKFPNSLTDIIQGIPIPNSKNATEPRQLYQTLVSRSFT